jgi:hypothetical protein
MLVLFKLVYMHIKSEFVQAGKSLWSNIRVWEKVAGANYIFRELFITAQENFIAYSRCRVCKTIYAPAHTVLPDTDLQKLTELHFSWVYRNILLLAVGVERL